MQTIIDPSLAPLGREPRLLGVDWIEPKNLPREQRYRTEAWSLTNGEMVVIVTDNGGHLPGQRFGADRGSHQGAVGIRAGGGGHCRGLDC